MTQPGEDPTHETYWVPTLANFHISWFDLVREFLESQARMESWGPGTMIPIFHANGNPNSDKTNSSLKSLS